MFKNYISILFLFFDYIHKLLNIVKISRNITYLLELNTENCSFQRERKLTLNGK